MTAAPTNQNPGQNPGQNPPQNPAPEGTPAEAYDVDALMVEFGGGADTGEEREDAALCRTVEDVYGPDSRFLIAEELADFLEQRGLTPTEFLHKEEPQRSFLDWPRRSAVLERVAALQSRPGKRTPAMRLEELRALEQGVLAITAQRAHKGAPPGFDAKSYAASVTRVMAATPGFAGRYTLDTWLSAWLGEGGSSELRLVRLLSLDSDALPPDGVAVLDQIIGEMLVSGIVIEDLFGWIDGLRPKLEAIAQLWKGEHASHPRAPAVVRRLATFIGTRHAAAARRGLEITIWRALTGDDRLAGGGSDPRTATAVLDELGATGLLAAKLTVDGALIGGKRTARLLDRRVASLLSDDRLEAMLKGKSHYARILDLLGFEGAVSGEQSRRIVLTNLQRHLEHREFTQRLFETARTHRARIKALADVQRRVQRSTLPDHLRDRYARMLDDIQYTYLRTNRLFARIAKDRNPAVEEVMEFANLLAEGAFAEGKCTATARDLIGHHVRATAFLRAYLTRCKDATEHRAERFAQFFATLAAAGLPMRDMGSLRILLADDEPAARGYVEMILRDLGIADIVMAEDGLQALSRFEQGGAGFDLIICDWKMPRLSGLEFLKLVRAKRPDMPFLMVTALATMIAVEEAMAHDVTAYIAKPFSPEQLEEKILVLVNRHSDGLR